MSRSYQFWSMCKPLDQWFRLDFVDYKYPFERACKKKLFVDNLDYSNLTYMSV